MRDAIRITSVLVAAIVLLALSPTEAEAVPPIPSSFYGTVKLNGSNVPNGTKVSAWIGEIKYSETETTTWGGDSVYSIDVPGDDPETPGKDGGVEGETIVFKIASYTADQTGTWHSGTNVELNLTAAEGPVTITPTFTPTPTNTPGRTPTPTPTGTPTATATPKPGAPKIFLPYIVKQGPPCGWNDPDDNEPGNDHWKSPDVPYGSGLFMDRTFWSLTQPEDKKGNDPDWFKWRVDWTGTHWLWTQDLNPDSLHIWLLVAQDVGGSPIPIVWGEAYGPGKLGVWLEQGQTYYVSVGNLTSPQVGCYSLWLQP